MIPSLCNKSCIERFLPLTCSPLRSVASEENFECFKILNGFTMEDKPKWFMIDDTSRTIKNGTKLKCRQVNSDCTKFIFAKVVVREWNKLPPEVVQCNTTYYFFRTSSTVPFPNIMLTKATVSGVYFSLLSGGGVISR